ncbi:MAG: hypothetical protein HYS15_03285 [Candidatus Spechtbacteria bacterium]|nr:hypothetical protein [Candidatus Spechtbacteria bacterium]
MLVQTWTDLIMSSLQGLWGGFIAFVPALVGAIVVFVVGWIVAMALEKVIAKIIKALQVDRIFDQLGVMKALQKAGFEWEFSDFVGWLVRWFLLIGFFLAAADILKLNQVAEFLKNILGYVPNIIVAALILLIAALLSNFLERLITTSMKAAGFLAPSVVGILVRWSVWIFAILAIFDQLGIAPNLTNTLFMGLVAFLAIAGGLAFGLGGQGVAKDLLERMYKEMKGR